MGEHEIRAGIGQGIFQELFQGFFQVIFFFEKSLDFFSKTKSLILTGNEPAAVNFGGYDDPRPSFSSARLARKR
jgi:hypothetical protein